MLDILASIFCVSSLYVVCAFHISPLFLFLDLFCNVPCYVQPVLCPLTRSKH